MRYLFGAVSLSAALPLAARELIVSYYERYHGDASGEAISRNPFRYVAAPPSFGELDAGTAFRVLKGNLDGLGATLPMLYKQYIELCEPGGARFLAFGVDPAFSNSIDGLVELDLQRIRPKKRARYLEAPTRRRRRRHERRRRRHDATCGVRLRCPPGFQALPCGGIRRFPQ